MMHSGVLRCGRTAAVVWADDGQPACASYTPLPLGTHELMNGG